MPCTGKLKPPEAGRHSRATAGETDLIAGLRADLAEVEDIAGEEMRLYLTDLALERARLALDVPAAFASPAAARAEAEAQTAKAAAMVSAHAGRNAPHPVLLPASSPWRAGTSTWPHPQADAAGEGTPELPAAEILASPLQPHLLADAATLRCKLAKASLRGEEQGEGRKVRVWPGLANRHDIETCASRKALNRP